MNKLLGFALGVLFVIGSQSIFAIKMNSIYQGEVPVNSQSEEARIQALPRALEQVLIKTSGNTQISNNARIKLSLTRANTLVQEFGFKAAISKSAFPYILEARFDPRSVHQLLREANAPIWGINRPLILAWISYQEASSQAELITTEDNLVMSAKAGAHQTIDNLATSLKQLALTRGLPLTFPLLDSKDLSIVSANDVIKMSPDNIITASRRYNSPIILIGHIIKETDQVTSTWKLLIDDDQRDLTFSGKTITDILPSLIDNMMNTLAAKYALMTSNTVQKNVSLQISGVSQHNEFSRLIQYLNQLTPVADVGVIRIKGKNILLNVNLRSSEEAFKQALALGHRLSPTQTIMNDLTNEQAVLAYKWNK